MGNIPLQGQLLYNLPRPCSTPTYCLAFFSLFAAHEGDEDLLDNENVALPPGFLLLMKSVMTWWWWGCIWSMLRLAGPWFLGIWPIPFKTLLKENGLMKVLWLDSSPFKLLAAKNLVEKAAVFYLESKGYIIYFLKNLLLNLSKSLLECICTLYQFIHFLLGMLIMMTQNLWNALNNEWMKWIVE